MKHIKFKLMLFVVLTGSAYSNLSAQSGVSLKLIYPAKGQTLKEPFPTFTWTPPVDASSQYLYNFRMVEVLEHQSPEAAMMANPDWYAAKRLTTNACLYLPSAPLLQAHKKYAWQVTAIGVQTVNEGKQKRELSSEVYWFEPAELNITICAVAPVKEQENNKSFYLLDSHVLRFNLPEKEKENGWSFNLADKQGNPVAGVKKVLPEFVTRGNYYQLALNQYSFFRRKENRKKLFRLHAVNNAGEKYVIAFMLK